jgi:glucuronoarabinoxylan endo-1,4-beta-xylanase
MQNSNFNSPITLTLPTAVKDLKARWNGAYFAVVIAIVLHAGLTAAQNLITNPGFETGNTSGWGSFGGSPLTLSAETSVVHSGTYAGQVSGRTQTYQGISQSLLGVLQSGQTYNVSAWVRLVSGVNQNVQMTVQKIDGSGTTYAAINSNSVSSTGWTQLSGQYTYNPSGTASGLTLYVEVPTSSSASYYIDDVVCTNNGVMVSNPPISGASLVDWNNVHQRIDGFGASSAWNGSWTAAEADVLFSTNNSISYAGGTYNGAGLSLLRNHIAFASTTLATDTPTTVETSIMQMAQARGARVWSTPWTPAAGFKSTNDIYDGNIATGNGINGGSYLGSGNNITNLNYASQLANYVASMKNSYGVNLYALSIQNEPDANVTNYEACQWSGAQFHDFVTNLYAALAAQGFGSTKIILPESENWTDPQNLMGPTLSDPAVAADVSIIADHDYVLNNSVGDQTVPAAISTQGKAQWETEVALLSGSDPSINNGVYFAQRVHLFLTQAQANAYHYWWLVNSGNQGLLDTSAGPFKRLFTIGQFSRFVRPNFYRIDATSSQTSALISAYKDSASPAFAIVAINTIAATNIIETFTLTNFASATVTPWITSATMSLAPQSAINVTNGTFTYTLPEMSVVTFVGQGTTNTPPTIAPVSDQTVNPGVTLLITNIASASDVPPQTLTFGAANTFPANATINPTNGVFSWRPHVSQANTTNVIQIKVTDSGPSNLSATNRFNVVVNPISSPVVSSITPNGGQINLLVNGPSGPDYTLLSSTDLMNWRSVLTVSSPTPPVTLSDTNYPNAPQQFYRIQLGP